MSDEELAQLESEYARMMIEHTTMAEQMVGLAQRIISERAMRRGRPDPDPDFRPRPSTPQPPYDPPSSSGRRGENGGDDLDPQST